MAQRRSGTRLDRATETLEYIAELERVRPGQPGLLFDLGNLTRGERRQYATYGSYRDYYRRAREQRLGARAIIRSMCERSGGDGA